MLLIKFDKMQSLGNDFVMVDLDQFSRKPLWGADFFRKICDRNYGIGCDTAVLYQKSNDGSQVQAEFFNADGSEAEICGNAARCLGSLMKERYGKPKFLLKAGGKICPILAEDEISVDMGKPSFDPEDIGFSKPVPDPLSVTEHLPCDADVSVASCISVGNPHLVLFVPEAPTAERTASLAKMSENSLFRNKINVSAAFVKSENEIILSVFERGAGPTLACGSGACAAVAVARLKGLVKSEKVRVYQRGGILTVSVDNEGNILQSGPASFVFCGEIYL
ncbi:MAG: diaminopimelate epimerase [Holosporaceae bacterium]|jgi:diaminopimelate epimerase|nr:diaminopimelate epimerase [Holosporaceae bacterium]